MDDERINEGSADDWGDLGEDLIPLKPEHEGAREEAQRSDAPPEPPAEPQPAEPPAREVAGGEAAGGEVAGEEGAGEAPAAGESVETPTDREDAQSRGRRGRASHGRGAPGWLIILLVVLVLAAMAAGAYAVLGSGILGGGTKQRGASTPAASDSATPATGTTEGTGATSAAGGQPAAETTPLPRASWQVPPLAKLGRVIEFGPDYRKEVALTFNAIESETPADFDEDVYDVLKRENVDATVFIGGKWLAHNRLAGRTLAGDDGIELGNASWDFPDYSDLSTEQIRAQIERTDALIEEVTGKQPVMVRLPYGSYNQRTLNALESLNAPIIGWDVVSGDPDPNVSAEAMTREVLARARAGSIVIMHINGRGVNTAQALPDIIKGLRDRGFDLVTVSALLR